jgi:hypothetical protein
VADEATPLGQAYRAYEQLEGRLSTALDQLVGSNGFADLLASSATNAMALTRLANGTVDQAVRATRLAARTDVTNLARQLARTEDKLERLLQAVEALQTRLDEVTPTVVARGEAPSATARSSRATASKASSEEPEKASGGDGSTPPAGSNGAGRTANGTPRSRSAAAKREAP